MQSPNSLSWVIYVIACCWPSPVAMLITGLVVTAIHKGWIKIKVDTTKVPRLNWRRNE